MNQPQSLFIYRVRYQPGMPERCEGKGGRFSWKGTFELIFSKRCLQNIGSWTSPNHVFYLLDDRGVRGFSARRLCYSWSSMTAFLAFSEASSQKNCTDNSLQFANCTVKCPVKNGKISCGVKKFDQTQGVWSRCTKKLVWRHVKYLKREEIVMCVKFSIPVFAIL
jgi:hypothetical protein